MPEPTLRLNAPATDHRAVNPGKGRQLRAGKRVPQAARNNTSGGGASLPRRRAK